MQEKISVSCGRWRVTGIGTALIFAQLFFLPAFALEATGGTPGTAPPPDKVQTLGQRMYREALLPSGEPLPSVVNGDVNLPGTSYPCISCHKLSGLGAFDGEIITTPVNSKSLFSPRRQPKGIQSLMSGGMSMGESRVLPPQPPPGRPSYTDETLAKALRVGIDPTGRALSAVMPRYLLNDQDMALLISYLKTLAAEHSPGVDGHTLRFATITSEDVPAEIRDEQAALLEKLFSRMNEQAKEHDKRLQNPKLNRHMSKAWRMLYRKLALSRWLLKGPPETWPGQLEAHYQREPVFALLGGITSGEWKPVHDFCEARRIPALFPVTDFPEVSEGGIYTLYLSKGFYQEGEAAARFLNRGTDAVNPPVVQIVRDSREGRALSAGFDKAWRELGHGPAPAILLQPGESVSDGALQALSTEAEDKPATVLLWDGPDALTLLSAIAVVPHRPERVIMSSSYLGRQSVAIPESYRDIAYLTYPYRLPKEEELLEEFFLGTEARSKSLEADAARIVKRSYPLTRIVIDALAAIKDNFYRDYFLDAISSNADLDVPLFGRLSFGSGRYASTGCYIVQLSKGTPPELVDRSGWIAE